jgi:photosynthetic reaction center cytochrome c subunit/tetratricopeptide repeat protein
MRTSLWVLGLVVAGASWAAAQTPAGAAPTPPPMTNLQIIPKDTPRPQVLQQMQAISAALGVQCNYCHVIEGRGGRNDMAADDKAAKKAARGMMLLSREINAKLPDAIGKAQEQTTRVGCATCHRGVPIPKQITDVVTDAAAAGGASAGLAKFRELREKFYGGQSYDFSENGLIATAQRAIAANKPDDALAYLQANVEYYPKSARSYVLMSQAHLAQQNKAGAVKDLEKALDLDPNNAQAKTQLETLKK